MRVSRKHLLRKLDRVKRTLVEDHIIELDGSGRQDVEWLVSILFLLLDGKLELSD